MKKNIVIIVLLVLVLGLGGYLVYDKVIDKEVKKEEVKEENNNQDKVQEENNNQDKVQEEKQEVKQVYGTYIWQEDYTNGLGANLTRKIKLIINEDKTASYENSDGMSSGSTIGTFEVNSEKVVYNPEYNNYPSDKSELDENSKTSITFEIVDEETLKTNLTEFNNREVTLKRQ